MLTKDIRKLALDLGAQGHDDEGVMGRMYSFEFDGETPTAHFYNGVQHPLTYTDVVELGNERYRVHVFLPGDEDPQD
ncbi:MAG: hypothetical protein EKK42_24475 [Pseudonocardiaceae bacterium]|nr:MAG: hypothetical protein EKK42_24475 [Pseudonocardiaceae bacterium]